VAKWRVYLKPYADDAGSSYEADWRDVTDDILNIGQLSQQLDNTDYDIGVFRSANTKIRLRNDHGRYGPAGELQSIFKYRRGGVKARITWQDGDEELYCGFFDAGSALAILADEEEVFEGLLDDNTTKSNIDEQTVEFNLQGYESILRQLIVPYSSISNGNSIEAVIYAICNQAPLNQYVTVLLANISCGQTETIDDKTSLENKTGLEALSDILLASSSVLYVEENVLYVKARTAEADVSYYFYGPGSLNGIENLLEINAYRTGENRILNFITWKDTTLQSSSAASIAKYGYRKADISSDIITNGTKRQAMLDAVRDEFSLGKVEFELVCPVTFETIHLFLLDRISVDYPTEATNPDARPIAIYGAGEYDVDYYAEEIFRLSISAATPFKVMSRIIDFAKQTMELSLREV
jgi:hypothetical protein